MKAKLSIDVICPDCDLVMCWMADETRFCGQQDCSQYRKQYKLMDQPTVELEAVEKQENPE